jgi:glycosyltransferase involved in cell wall biosynthesis
MMTKDIKLVVVSHAGIKQINRAVYRILKKSLREVVAVVPARLTLGSGTVITAESSLPDDPEIVPLELSGTNPRTYFYPELIHQLDRYRPDVVLLENDPVSKLGFQLAGWCRKNRARLICQTYENLRRDVKTTFRQQGWKAVFKNLAITCLNYWMAKRIDALVVVNKDSESIFREYGYRNVFLTPLGYDPGVFFMDGFSRQTCRESLKISDDTVLVAYFGRLVPQKGVHLLIEALASLKSLNWMLLLDHIHDSEDQYVSFIQDLIAKQGLKERVIYFEADHFEIANYMRAADIMVAPSITTTVFKEQYGRAVQEAMACGCVTLVSNSGHLKDLVGNSELVFQEGNIEMLKDRIENLLKDRNKRMELGASLSARASSRLTTDCHAIKLNELLTNFNVPALPRGDK